MKLSNTDQNVLAALQNAENNRLSEKALAETTGIRKSTLTRSIKKLHDGNQVNLFDDEGEWFVELTLEAQNVEEAPAPTAPPAEPQAPEQPALVKKPKWQTTLDLIENGDGVTATEIANALGVTLIAAKSLVADVKRKGYKVEFDRKSQRYSAPEA